MVWPVAWCTMTFTNQGSQLEGQDIYFSRVWKALRQINQHNLSLS